MTPGDAAALRRVFMEVSEEWGRNPDWARNPMIPQQRLYEAARDNEAGLELLKEIALLKEEVTFWKRLAGEGRWE